MTILISCETGGENVPRELIGSNAMAANFASRHNSDLLKLLRDTDDLRRNKRKRPGKKRFTKYGPGQLPAHLRHDAAARYVSQRMARRLSSPIIENQYSMDLIDVTRSINHPQLFPALTRQWSAEHRQTLIDQIYQPYRNRILKTVAEMLGKSSYVVHLSIRSFESLAPAKLVTQKKTTKKSSTRKSRARAKPRRADVGLLYDVSAVDEVDLSADLCEEMYYEAEMLKVRRNYPRRGTVDSLTKAMRIEFEDQYYIGLEILVNQAWALRKGSLRQEAVDRMCDSIQGVLQTSQSEAA